MKKLKESSSPLINRTQMVFEIEHFQKSTPKKAEIVKDLASELKIAQDLIHIKKIVARFGSTKSKIVVDIYKSKEDLKSYANIGKKEKTQEVKEVKAETPQAEE